MPRMRYSLPEAIAKATRLAAELVAGRPDREQWRHIFTFPKTVVPRNPASKHPVAWVVAFAPVPQADEAIDGGELWVAVDLIAGSAELCGWMGMAYPLSTPASPDAEPGTAADGRGS